MRGDERAGKMISLKAREESMKGEVGGIRRKG